MSQEKFCDTNSILMAELLHLKRIVVKILFNGSLVKILRIFWKCYKMCEAKIWKISTSRDFCHYQLHHPLNGEKFLKWPGKRNEYDCLLSQFSQVTFRTILITLVAMRNLWLDQSRRGKVWQKFMMSRFVENVMKNIQFLFKKCFLVAKSYHVLVTGTF